MRCTECEAKPIGPERGWRALRADVPGEDEHPALAFYCPACAEREFGPRFASRFAEPS